MSTQGQARGWYYAAQAASRAVEARQAKKSADRKARRSEDIAKKNADAIAKETADAVANLKEQRGSAVSKGTAAVGTSGVKLTGSQADYLDQLRNTYDVDIGRLEEGGRSRRDIEIAKGGLKAQGHRDRGRASAYSSLFQGFGDLAKYGTSKESGWWT